MVHINELGLNYDKYLPFNNVYLNENYILVKQNKLFEGRAKEQLAVEPLYQTMRDEIRNLSFDSNKQISRAQHPGSLNANSLLDSEQICLFTNYKTRTRGFGKIGKGNCNMKFLSMDTFKLEDGTEHKRSSTISRTNLINQKQMKGTITMHLNLGRDLKNLASAPIQDRVLLNSISSTEAVYNPNFEVGMIKLAHHVPQLEKQLSRSELPTGKLSAEPNLVVIKHENGISVDSNKVCNAYNMLGHLAKKVQSPNFTLRQGRDLSLYMQSEAIRNIMRENELL